MSEENVEHTSGYMKQLKRPWKISAEHKRAVIGLAAG
jgi:hypothetical protein